MEDVDGFELGIIFKIFDLKSMNDVIWAADVLISIVDVQISWSGIKKIFT